ncbi:FtsX-like permease family protein [Clostridium sp. KNHs214]|uniref:ABC transporter permease n=1 Tax=Clostridium sp. KNHs214 TaxID=1540257 RepID=UPI000551BD31|nr:FtsX-like permease family protein [Clostridium sp. KNHs214]
MKSFWGLIPKYLIKNKKRNFFVAVGIMLSISLIVSLSLVIRSLKKSAYERSVDESGGVYDNMFFTSDKKSLDKLVKDPLVNKISISCKLGEYKVPNSEYIVKVNGYDENIREILNFKLIEGNFPKKNNEIAIQDWVLNAMPKKYKVGDKIKLNLAVGNSENSNIEKEFIISGIFSYKFNNYLLKNIAVAYVPRSYAESIVPLEEISYEGYFTIKPNEPIEKSCNSLAFRDEYKRIKFNLNISKMFLFKCYKIIDSISIILYAVISIVASVIIYNIFNMSITERTREFGMLRAVGASPGKIKILVLGEGVILGCIFIPLGIVIGNFITRSITVLIAGYKDMWGIMSIPKEGIIASFIVGFLSIVFGSYFPAKKASKISPIEAINSNNNLKLKGQKIKGNLQDNSIISKKFGFTLNMARLNLNRNKKKFITTVISLSISIIMFMIVSYLINSCDFVKNIERRMEGDFVISTALKDSNYTLSDEDVEYIESIKGVDKVNKEKKLTCSMEVPEKVITDEGFKFLAERSKLNAKIAYDFSKQIYYFDTEVKGLTQEQLNSTKKHLIKGKIDEEELQDKSLAILAQNLNYSKHTKLNVGDKIKLNYYIYDKQKESLESNTKIFTIGAILKDNYKTDDFQIHNVLIISNKIFEKYLKNKDYQKIKIILGKNANYEEIEKKLKNKYKSHREVTVESYKEEIEKAKKSSLKFLLIMYSFVAVVAIVSITNLINIMSMNIILRKREIGMMRAIGLGEDEVKRMIREEGIFYGIASAFWGAIMGTIFTYIIFLISRRILIAGMTWSFPIGTIVLVILVTVGVCILASINASRRVFSSSIVDSIRMQE